MRLGRGVFLVLFFVNKDGERRVSTLDVGSPALSTEEHIYSSTLFNSHVNTRQRGEKHRKPDGHFPGAGSPSFIYLARAKETRDLLLIDRAPVIWSAAA